MKVMAHQYSSAVGASIAVLTILSLALPLVAILTPRWAHYARPETPMLIKTSHITEIGRDFEYDHLWVGPFYTSYNQLPLRNEKPAPISPAQVEMHPEAPEGAIVTSEYDNHARTISGSYTSKIVSSCYPLTTVENIGAFYSLLNDDQHRCEKFRSSQAFFVLNVIFKAMAIALILASAISRDFRENTRAAISGLLLASCLSGATGLLIFTVGIKHNISALGSSTSVMISDVVFTFLLLIATIYNAPRHQVVY